MHLRLLAEAITGLQYPFINGWDLKLPLHVERNLEGKVPTTYAESPNLAVKGQVPSELSSHIELSLVS